MCMHVEIYKGMLTVFPPLKWAGWGHWTVAEISSENVSFCMSPQIAWDIIWVKVKRILYFLLKLLKTQEDVINFGLMVHSTYHLKISNFFRIQKIAIFKCINVLGSIGPTDVMLEWTSSLLNVSVQWRIEGEDDIYWWEKIITFYGEYR